MSIALIVASVAGREESPWQSPDRPPSERTLGAWENGPCHIAGKIETLLENEQMICNCLSRTSMITTGVRLRSWT